MNDEELLQEILSQPGEFREEIKVLQLNRDDWEYDGEFMTVEEARAHCARRLAYEQRPDSRHIPMSRKIVRQIVYERVLEELPV